MMAKISGGKIYESVFQGFVGKVGKASKVEVGFMADATYPDGTQVALVATVQEFGSASRNIPPRPFFRNMIAAHKDGWPATAGRLLIDNNFDAEKTLSQLGEGIKGQLQEAITTFSGVPLAPGTVQRKGSAKQLVDTGQMLSSVDYRVK